MKTIRGGAVSGASINSLSMFDILIRVISSLDGINKRRDSAEE